MCSRSLGYGYPTPPTPHSRRNSPGRSALVLRWSVCVSLVSTGPGCPCAARRSGDTPHRTGVGWGVCVELSQLGTIVECSSKELSYYPTSFFLPWGRTSPPVNQMTKLQALFFPKKAARPHSRPTPAAVGVPALGGDYGSGGVGPRVALPGAGSHIGLSQGYCILCAAEGPYQ